MSTVRVLVVDDSPLVRELLSDVLERHPRILVVDTASDPYQAREKIKRHDPDVLTLDVEMPRMDGLTFLRNLMRLRPMPVVMVSVLTEGGARATMDALALGAVDFVLKPRSDLSNTLEEYAEELHSKVLAAAEARTANLAPRRPPSAREGGSSPKLVESTQRIIAIGASTGGTEAIKAVVGGLPPDAPGIVIGLHIPPVFSRSFAQRLDLHSAMRVVEAEDGQVVVPGHAYVAPGDSHLRLRREGGQFVCRLGQDPPVSRHRPSVDVLFSSVAESVGTYALGTLLTGMGKDGAQGLLEMRRAGAATAAQDEATSVVWGMPGEAVRLGAAGAVVPLGGMGEWLLEALAMGQGA